MALVVMVLFSCGKETLTPIYQPMTVNQLRSDEPIRFSYQIDDTQIDEYAKNAGKFPLFGKLFQAIAIVLANSTISSSGGHNLDLPPVDVDLSTLSSIDFTLVQGINLDNLMVNIRNAKSKDTLAFIDKIELLVKLDSPVPDLPVDAQGFSRLVYYDNTTDAPGCDGRCIKLHVADVDWKRILQTNKLVHIQPKLVINSVPVSSMKLAGAIDFSIKFNLGF